MLYSPHLIGPRLSSQELLVHKMLRCLASHHSRSICGTFVTTFAPRGGTRSQANLPIRGNVSAELVLLAPGTIRRLVVASG